MVPGSVWIHNDCDSVDEFTETAAVSQQLRQGVSLLVAELAEEKDREERITEDDEDVLLAELDGQLQFPGRRKSR
jgi:hypothetical protein